MLPDFHAKIHFLPFILCQLHRVLITNIKDLRKLYCYFYLFGKGTITPFQKSHLQSSEKGSHACTSGPAGTQDTEAVLFLCIPSLQHTPLERDPKTHLNERGIGK